VSVSRSTQRRVVATAAIALLVAIAMAFAGTAAAAEPTFVDGQSQPVFSSNMADWTNEEVWIESEIDSDFDGSLDLVHADISRVPETNTNNLKVPVVLEISPYYAGSTTVVSNWPVDHEIGQPPASRNPSSPATLIPTSPSISTSHESTWVPRGFAVMHAESLGSGLSEGCATSGGRNETLGAKAVIDWLAGRARGYTNILRITQVTAGWWNGRAGMIGTSYNGTLPNAAATTGVLGLEAIIPISAISNWYDYYRANGMVRAPGGFQGEDLDVLAEYVYSQPDRLMCRSVIQSLAASQDRVTGNYSPFWHDRDYMKDIDNVHAAVLVAHGNNDNNVMTKNAAQFYEAVKARGVPHQIYLHQGGHGGAPPLKIENLWFTRYLWNVPGFAELEPRAWIVREGQLASMPTAYAEWPDPAMSYATLNLTPGAPTFGGLTFQLPQPGLETLTDNATITATTLMNAATSPNRLVFRTPLTSAAIRISGTPRVSLRLSSSTPKANLTAMLVSYPASGNGTIHARGWMDPENRNAIDVTDPVTPGTMYQLNFDMQPKDSVIAAGRRIGLVVMSSDNEYTIRPAPGTQLTLDLAGSSVKLPVVGGGSALAQAIGVTAPTVGYTLSPAAPTGSNGWYTGNVSLTWQVGDGGAALTKTGCVDEVFSTDGQFTRSCSASNVVGTAGPVSVTVKVDKTPPGIAVSTPTEGAEYGLNSTVAASYSCDDDASGVASCDGTVPSGQPIDTSSPGPHTFTVTARDLAGNTNTRTINYTVAGPTAVRLLTFSATRRANDTRVRWRTASEAGVLGFAVYRAQSGRRVRVSPRLIAASGRPGAHVYSWVDRTSARRGVRYFLQAVRFDGSRAWLSSTVVR
jgi:X-Pro dipeptidyl-peptidase